MGIRILIADDEPNQLELLTYNLVQADYEVIRAEDGQQALDLSRTRSNTALKIPRSRLTLNW